MKKRSLLIINDDFIRCLVNRRINNRTILKSVCFHPKALKFFNLNWENIAEKLPVSPMVFRWQVRYLHSLGSIFPFPLF